MKKGKFILYLVLVASCMALTVGCTKSNKNEEENPTKIKVMIKNSDAKTNKITEEDQENSTQKNEAEEPKEKPGIELIGIEEKHLDVLGIEKETIEKAFQKWTSENGYASVSGAVFYDPMSIFFLEEKYSMNCTLIFSNEGNGIQPENEQKMITMDYYKGKNLIQFHE